MAANLPTEFVRLLRFQILDARNGAISGEPDAIRLCGYAADEIERLLALCEQYEADIADFARKLTSPADVTARPDPLADVRWICPKCTTVNSIDDETCLGGACGTKQPTRTTNP